MNVFARVRNAANKMLRGTDYQVTLTMEQNQILFSVYRGNRKVPFAQLYQDHSEFRRITPLILAQGDQIIVPLQNLERVRADLGYISGKCANDSVKVSIAPEVARLKPRNIPDNFSISYIWSDSAEALIQEIQGGRAYCGKGWFVAEDAYWNVPGINETDDPWLVQTMVRGKDVIEIVNHLIPGWKKRGIPVTSEVVPGSGPAFTLVIAAVGDSTVSLEITWRINPKDLKAYPSLEGYVFAGPTLIEGINPAVLPVKLQAQSGTFALKGSDIAVFRQEVFPRISRWTTGDIERFLQTHQVIPNAGELILSVERLETVGVGRAEAVPVFVCGGDRATVGEIIRRMGPRTEYIRLAGGWHAVEKLKRLGIGPDGRLPDQTALDRRITLSAAEILHGGSRRLEGPWKRIVFPEMNIPTGPMRDIARQHLQFLIEWGVPGGIAGVFHRYEDEVYKVLSGHLKTFPKARILIVGKKAALDALPDRWKAIVALRFEGNMKDPETRFDAPGLLYVATVNALETRSGLRGAQWDILLILQPDALIRSDTSRFYETLLSCKARLVLGTFRDSGFLGRRQSFVAISDIFGIPENEDVWNYSLRNLLDGRVILPQPFQPENGTVVQTGGPGAPAEFIIANGVPDQAVPIPPRKKEQARDKEVAGSSRSVHRRDGGRRESDCAVFLAEAERLAGYTEKVATFVPFTGDRPTYAAMSPLQRKWYFHWRGRVRAYAYPDTALSYILVHVYELINNIGVRNPTDGYCQLYNLWTGYRERHPRLDDCLVNWIMDYAALNQCDVDAGKIYARLPNSYSCQCYLDLLIDKYSKSAFSLPLELIVQLVDYDVRRSDFFLYHHALIEEYVLKAMKKVDAYLVERHQRGILQLFKPGGTERIEREPFQNAIHGYGNARHTVIETHPYSKSVLLRTFLTGIMKHTENILREFKRYPGRLQDYTLEPEIAALIDDCITSGIYPSRPQRSNWTSIIHILNTVSPEPPVTVSPEPPVKPAPTISIDEAKVAQLISDSDKVRDMLTVTAEHTQAFAEDTNVSLSIIAGPPGTQKHRPGLREPETDSVAERNGEALDESSGLPEEWKLFRENMTAYQIQTLAALWQKDDSLTGIDRLAGDSFLMPEMLIDSINELALNHIGDMLILAESSSPAINEAYLEIVKLITA